MIIIILAMFWIPAGFDLSDVIGRGALIRIQPTMLCNFRWLLPLILYVKIGW